MVCRIILFYWRGEGGGVIFWFLKGNKIIYMILEWEKDVNFLEKMKLKE